MKSWLALIVGIAIGWLIGWLFDKWYRGRRSASDQPASAPVAARPVEIELPRRAQPSGAASPEAASATLLAAEAAASRDERSLEEAEHETPPEVNWEELYAEAQERSGEVGLEPQIDSAKPLEPAAVAPASLGSELPEEPVALPPGAVEALSPTPDDLTVIEGIGPVYAARLNEAGISTYARLAECSPEELAGIIQAPSWRKMYFPEWIEQARLLRDQEHERLREMQSRLFKRKKG